MSIASRNCVSQIVSTGEKLENDILCKNCRSFCPQDLLCPYSLNSAENHQLYKFAIFVEQTNFQAHFGHWKLLLSFCKRRFLFRFRNLLLRPTRYQTLESFNTIGVRCKQYGDGHFPDSFKSLTELLRKKGLLLLAHRDVWHLSLRHCPLIMLFQSKGQWFSHLPVASHTAFRVSSASLPNRIIGQTRWLQAADRNITNLSTVSHGEQVDGLDFDGLFEYSTDQNHWSRAEAIENKIKDMFKIFGQVQGFPDIHMLSY